MCDKGTQEIAEMQKDIEECQHDIDKMLKEMEGYEKTFANAAQWLREKIEKDPANPVYILTRRGAGYYFAL